MKYKTNGFLLNSSSPSFVSSIHIQGCILSTGQFKDEQHFTFMYLNPVKDEVTPGGQSMGKLRHSRCRVTHQDTRVFEKEIQFFPIFEK